jgi:flagellum-specific ATP synthase
MITHPILERLRETELIGRTGRVTKVLPTSIEADGPAAPLGALCRLETTAPADGRACAQILAEVVGVHQDHVVLAPLETSSPTFPGARVAAAAGAGRPLVGDGFLGRAIDGLGRPIDGLGPIEGAAPASMAGARGSPLDKVTSATAVATGVRAIDGLLTLGRGQRVGIFAASGVGKTNLVQELARNVEADRCVVCLVGERGREVAALWSQLPADGKSRTAMVAATSDESAAVRVRATQQALALAEHWRSRGDHVLFLLDSVTRLAMALREIGLAAGEPPTVRAYTPSVFAALPKIVERCGALRASGAITAVLTVLSETDDNDDPICEVMKALLDGHIVLSRSLAEQGHYPAIDAPKSISRLASHVQSDDHRAAAAQAVKLLAAYESGRLLIEAGMYVAGSNPDIDLAIEKRPAIMAFLAQASGERIDFDATYRALAGAVGGEV